MLLNKGLLVVLVPKQGPRSFFVDHLVPGVVDHGLQIILIKEINKAQVSGKRQYVEIIHGIS